MSMFKSICNIITNWSSLSKITLSELNHRSKLAFSALGTLTWDNFKKSSRPVSTSQLWQDCMGYMNITSKILSKPTKIKQK